MGKITITMDVDDEDFYDPDHPTGLTSEGFDQVHDALSSFGDDIQIERA